MRRPWKNFDAFTGFARLALSTQDVDPVYPVLRHLGQGMDLRQRVWMALLHVAYYDLGSALAVLDSNPAPRVPAPEQWKLPCGTERRGHRDPRQLLKHLQALADLDRLHGGLDQWAADLGGYGYPRGYIELTGVRGNGRWAAYKTSELLAETIPELCAALLPTDMGHAHSTGPRQGLELILDGLPPGSAPHNIAILDDVSRSLVRDLQDKGMPATAASTETVLCDWHSLVGGRYYAGHDIDQMMEQLVRTPSGLTGAAFEARFATLPHEYLGELCGWNGVDKARRTVFRDQGLILARSRQEALT